MCPSRRSLVCTGLLALACIVSTLVQAEVDRGTAVGKDGFAFGSKFCFMNQPVPNVIGTADIHLSVPVIGPSSLNYSEFMIVVYDDEAEFWPQVLEHWDDWTCQQKVDVAKTFSTYPACVAGETEGCWSLSEDGSSHRLKVSNQPHTVTRPRFWYYAFAHCRGGLTDLDYHFHFTQYGESEWNRELGQNIAGLNSLYLSMFFVFVLLLVIHARGTYQLAKEIQYVHPLLKLFWIVLIIQLVSIFSSLIHFGVFSRDGRGAPALMKLGVITSIIARAFFILLLLLVAKGWTISSERLTHRWAVAAICGAYLIVAIALQFYTWSAEDPMSSNPSNGVEAATIVMNLVWLAFAIWFVVQVFLSWRKEANPDKKSMFMKFGLLFALWMILPPITSFLTFAIDPWARERVVVSFNLAISVFAFSLLAFLFWPSRASKFFNIATPDVSGGVNSEYEQL
jgi:hypothetical protein